MEDKHNPKAMNNYSKGKLIYSEGKAIDSIAFILKGKVLAYNDGVKFSIGIGNFIGVQDLYFGKYQTTYMAMEDIVIYVFSISRIEELKGIITGNNEYSGYMVASLNNYIKELDRIYHLFIRYRSNLFHFLKDNYKEYIEFISRLGYIGDTSADIQELALEEYDWEIYREQIEYYKDSSHIPIDTMKEFYSYGKGMIFYQLNEQSQIINEQIKTLNELADELAKMVKYLAGGEESLFYLLSKIAVELERANKSSSDIVEIMDGIVGQTNAINKFYENNVGRKELEFDKKMMEEAYNLILSGVRGQERSNKSLLKYTEEDARQALKQMSNAYEKLLNYADVSVEEFDDMMETMTDFVNLRDRMSSDNGARSIRRDLTNNYYVIYKKIFLKAYQDKSPPRLVDLYLRYGFADERLLSQENLLSLYYLEEKKSTEIINIYNIKDWLTLIYEGKKEPSKNEFDQEYSEVIIYMKQQGKLSDKEEKQWRVDKGRKLEYEIDNMFKVNNKLTNGQISTFVPVLHEDIIYKDFDKTLLSGIEIEETIKDLLKIDPTIFDREVIYSNQKKQIVREYIIKKVYPDIILMPTVGNRAIMWQDISMKKRDSPGRFILPMFFQEDLKEVFIKLFGDFRWEICRTVEGVYWNDIKYKSLTSEYSDYLQFYRKNKELSEAIKDKVKLQIQKGRRNSRNIFTLDYEQWILYESKGAIKLNKTVREILATYCPFSKEIREQLERQPMFKDSIQRFERDKIKKIREIDYRKRQLKKEGIDLPKELEDTLDYYNNL